MIEKNGLSLYVRGMFITDQLSEILPPYFELLQGVIESSDIPLNVSRSQLQVDPTVRKISQYISRKVAEKIKELAEADRTQYEKVWDSVGPFVKYGMVRDEDFAKRVKELVLVRTTDGATYFFPEYKAKISTVKDHKGSVVGFYVNDLKKQGALAQLFQAKGHLVILADTVIDPYWLSYLEVHENMRFIRVDAEEAPRWLESSETDEALTLSEKQSVKEAIEKLTNLKAEPQSLGSSGPAALLVREESQRRLYEAALSGESPAPSRIVFNIQHPIYRRYLLTQDIRWLEHAVDWARLLSGDLREADLRNFLERDWKLLSGA
ncbi:MAG: hypothetical protein ABDH66_08675 [Bacteroidia bacterium]